MAEIVVEGFPEFQQKLQQISAAARGPMAEDAVTEGAAVIQFHAQLNAANVFSRNQRGQLRNSIIPDIKRTENGAEAVIGPRVVYGRIQELGGTIRPIRAKALHFRIDNRDIFVKQVTLPARPYLGPAVNDHMDEIRAVMQESIAASLAEFGGA